MRSQAYIAIKGSKQGQFKGSIGHKWTPVLSFSMGIVSPRDAATGQASGKRQYKPIRISIDWGDASPQIFSAMVNNELLDKVIISLQGPNSVGLKEEVERIELEKAVITEINTHSGGGREGHKQVQGISFTYQDVYVGHGEHKTASDDWEMERFAVTSQNHLSSPQLRLATAPNRLV